MAGQVMHLITGFWYLDALFEALKVQAHLSLGFSLVPPSLLLRFCSLTSETIIETWSNEREPGNACLLESLKATGQSRKLGMLT